MESIFYNGVKPKEIEMKPHKTFILRHFSKGRKISTKEYILVLSTGCVHPFFIIFSLSDFAFSDSVMIPTSTKYFFSRSLRYITLFHCRLAIKKGIVVLGIECSGH